jgi:predicted porin
MNTHRLLALAAGTLACPFALAQSSVTLFGVADAAVSVYRADGGGTKHFLSSGNLASGRLGVRGVEDLGGGLAASFWLEAGVTNDDGRGANTSTNNQPNGSAGGGALTFNRRSTVSLSGPFGELRLGRDYTPSFWNLSVFDPFGVLGVAQIGHFGVVNAAATAVRASNSIGYFTPGCSAAAGCPGFYGQAMVALGENASSDANPDDGRYAGVRAGFNRAGWQVAVAHARHESAAAGDFTQTNAGAAYDAGVARVSVLLAENRTGQAGGAIAGVRSSRYAMLGATWRFDPAQELRFSFAKLRLDNANGSEARQLGLGYVHHLSKRTALYAFWARIDNRRGVVGSPRIGLTGGPAMTEVNGSASGLDLGLRHTF